MTPPTSRLRLEFLGMPKMVRDGVATTISDRKLALLLFMLAARGRCARIDLAACLWPEADPDKQLASMRLRVHKLRQLEPALLGSDGPELQLSAQVEHDLSSLRRSQDMPLETALALADTPLLSGIDLRGLEQIECMVEGFRDLMVAQAVDAIVREVLSQRAEARMQRCIELLHKVLVLAPLNESACRHLMLCHLLDHDRSSALRVFERFRETTRRLLGVEPGVHTTRLHARILLDEQQVLDEFVARRERPLATA